MVATVGDLLHALSLQRESGAAPHSASTPSSRSSAGSGAGAAGSAVVVDTLPALRRALAQLRGSSAPGVPLRLAVDCEGLDLDRHGKLCLLALCAQPPAAGAGSGGGGSVFLVDISALGGQAFSTPAEGSATTTLKSLLEDPSIEKLLFDVRTDSDALYHQYGVRLAGVLDLQLAEVAVRRYAQGLRVRFVAGLARALDEHLPYSLQALRRASGVNKAAMVAQFEADAKFWDRRPLSREQVCYAAADVAYLHALRDVLMSKLAASYAARVRSRSEGRSREYDIPYAQLPKGRDRALAPSV